jgi:hypothetical protein
LNTIGFVGCKGTANGLAFQPGMAALLAGIFHELEIGEASNGAFVAGIAFDPVVGFDQF